MDWQEVLLLLKREFNSYKTLIDKVFPNIPKGANSCAGEVCLPICFATIPLTPDAGTVRYRRGLG